MSCTCFKSFFRHAIHPISQLTHGAKEEKERGKERNNRRMEPDHGESGVVGSETSLGLWTLWPAMVDKIHHPEKYLPHVSDVVTRPTADGSGTYREMTLNGSHTMREDIYADAETGRIEFRVVDRNLVVVNQYRHDLRAIEYVLEDTERRVLGWWKGMREGTYHAILNQYQIAQKGEF